MLARSVAKRVTDQRHAQSGNISSPRYILFEDISVTQDHPDFSSMGDYVLASGNNLSKLIDTVASNYLYWVVFDVALQTVITTWRDNE